MIVAREEPQRYTTFPSERDVLLWLMLQAPEGPVAEIGGREGRTTAFLAPHARTEYWVVDPWDGRQDGAGDDIYRDFVTRTAHLGVVVWRGRSHDAPPPPGLAFVFHDGDHRHPDLRKWYDALVPGGILAVHDVCDPGWPKVREAMEDLGKPLHEYRYHATLDEVFEYGPGLRGLMWKVKP